MTPLGWLGRKTTAQTNKLPTALDGTLWNKLTLEFYEFMKKKREHFCPEFAQLRMFFHTYEMHFCLLITTWYALRFKLSVEFVKHAFRLWFLLIFYDEVYRWQISSPCLGSRQIILKPNTINQLSAYNRPRWLSWMRRPTGDQEVVGSTPAEVGNILSWRLIMKYFLRSFSPFRWFKKGSCQFLAKECAQYWLTA